LIGKSAAPGGEFRARPAADFCRIRDARLADPQIGSK
jgi:hypothetical protein